MNFLQKSKQINIDNIKKNEYNRLNIISINMNKENTNFSILMPDYNIRSLYNENLKNFELQIIYDEIIKKESSFVFSIIDFNKIIKNENCINLIKHELKKFLFEIKKDKNFPMNNFCLKIKIDDKSENYLCSIDEIISNI